MKLKFDFLIGIESHVQLFCDKKLFSFIKKYNCNPNCNISYFDLAIPGTLPVLNFFFLNKLILLGLFIKSNIYNISFFLRKNYFYPDISKNYQITQNNLSFLKNGYILLYNNYVFNPYYKLIKLKHIHFEEDTAKIIYNNNYSFLDYNRSGSILLEIVSFPEISNIYECILYINNLRYFLKFLNISDCIMERGSFRFDINFSLKELSGDFPDYKIELKNLNSFNSLFILIDHEIKKLIYFYLNGDFVFSKTIGYDSFLNKSFFIRKKENYLQYKYFLDPDIFYIFLKKKNIYYVLNKFFNWFFFLKILNNDYKKYVYFLDFFLYKKNFYLFLIFGFYFTKYNHFFNIFNKKNIFLKKYFSFEQIFLLFYFYYFNYINFKVFKKIFFFIYFNKIFFNYYIYKIFFFNCINKSNDLNILLNYYVLDNLFLIHNYIFNKNLFNFFFLYFINKGFNINSKFFFFFLKKKYFSLREIDERFKSRN